MELPSGTQDRDLLLPEGGNAMDAFKQVFQVGTKQYAFGEMVESINGVKADSGHYWALYVNDEYATKGLPDYKAQDGMKIAWKYEKIADFGK